MKDLSTTIQKVLGKPLSEEGYDVVELIPIPSRGDKMVRLRTLEEALDDFEIGFLVQLRSKQSDALDKDDFFVQMVNETFTTIHHAGEPSAFETPPHIEKEVSKPKLDGIYLPNGKMNVPYLIQNAELLTNSGEFALARNIYKTVLHSGERSEIALFGIAKCFEAEGKFEDSLKHYEESIIYHPLIETYERMITLLIRLKKDQQAAEAIERALNLKGIQVETKFELHKSCANCWLRLNKTENAEIHYRKALELNPMADSILSNLGVLYLQKNNLFEAKRLFQETLAINSKNDKALFGMGSCAILEGDKRVAHDYFVKTLDLELNNPAAVFYLIKCAYEIKSYAAAARIVGEYIQIAPVNVNLLYSLAGLQFHLGRMLEAKNTTHQILQLQPNHSGALELYQKIDKYMKHTPA